jgi:type I restriction enzyme R subunit
VVLVDRRAALGSSTPRCRQRRSTYRHRRLTRDALGARLERPTARSTGCSRRHHPTVLRARPRARRANRAPARHQWARASKERFLLVSQFSVTGALYTCRPDLVGFVNGLPLVVIELKKPGVPA